MKFLFEKHEGIHVKLYSRISINSYKFYLKVDKEDIVLLPEHKKLDQIFHAGQRLCVMYTSLKYVSLHSCALRS